MFDSNSAHDMPPAAPWDQRLSSFQRLCLLRCLRPDKAVLAIQEYVGQQLGSRFVEQPPTDLAACFRESAPGTPLIFVLSPGADPMADLLKLAGGCCRACDWAALCLDPGVKRALAC